MSKSPIARECPVCGKVISIVPGTTIPAGIEYIKTKRHSVVLVHTNCIQKEVAK